MDLPVKISGYRSRPINGIIDYLDDGGRDDSFDPGARRQVDYDQGFRVHKVGETSVHVHGCAVLRWSGGTHHYLGLTVDGPAVSETPNLVKTITGITASGYIALSLDNATTPTTLTAAFSADPPENSGTVIPIAKITCSGGVITQVKQLKTGLWQSSANVDNKSLNLNSSGQLQDYGWATAVSIGSYASLAVTDLFMFQGYAGGADPLAKNYISMDVMLDAIAAWIILDGTGPWGDGNAPWEQANAVLHTNLLFTGGTAGKAGTNPDHDERHLVKGAGVGTTAITSNYLTALARQMSGTIVNDLAIDLTNSTLYDAGTPTVARLKWDSTPQLLLDWECTGKFNQTTDTTDATSKTAGAIMSAGGIAAVKDVWSGATVHADTGFSIDTNNYWTAANHYVASSSNVSLVGQAFAGIGSANCGASFINNNIVVVAETGDIAVSFLTLHINGNEWQEEDITVIVGGVEVTRTVLTKV